MNDNFPTFRKAPKLFKTLLRVIALPFTKGILPACKFLWRAKKLQKVLLALILLCAVSYGAFDYYATFLLRREYTKIRQQNQPLYFTEVINKPIPNSENAALLYIQAEQILQLPKDFEFLTDISQKQESAIVRDNQKSMQLIEHASRLSQSSFPVEWNGDPTYFLNSNMVKTRKLARFIRLNALQNARENNYQKAFQQIGFMNLLAEHTANGDTLISFLVARAINRIAVRTTNTILQNAKLTKEQALEYSLLLRPIDWHQLFYENMCGERTFNISSFEYYLSDIWNRRVNDSDGFDIPDEPAKFKHRGFITRPLLKMEEVYSLRLWQKVLLHAKQPGVIDANYETQMEKQLDQLPFYASSAKETFEMYARAFMNRDYPETNQRQQEIACALNAYKTQRGNYPNTLKTLEHFWGKKIPLDPYTNRPFLYRFKKNDYVLYSVGPNRVDDGGIKQLKGKWDFSKITDLIWDDDPS